MSDEELDAPDMTNKLALLRHKNIRQMMADARETAERLAAEHGATVVQTLNSPHMLVGPVEGIAETLLRRREQYGISYIVFLGSDLDSISPVVEQLSGS